MKFCLLFILFFCGGVANSQDAEEQDRASDTPKKGEEIWLEEKISPTTTWIEDLVKPLTTWMEQKINAPEREAARQGPSERSEGTAAAASNESNIERDDLVGSFITAEQASKLAREHIAGNVLHIKLIPKSNRYRVKLISELGEIFIVYVHAVSGDIVFRDNRSEDQSLTQDRKGVQVRPHTDSERDTKERP